MSSNKSAKKCYKDRTNQKYGKLTAIKYVYTNKRRKAVWLCECECGNYIKVSSDNLITKNIKSCGCLYKKARTENIKKAINKNTKYENEEERDIMHKFSQMKSRCYNSKHKAYKNYGGRGIKIFKEWLENPKKFFEWSMSNGYQQGLSIDRIDVNGNYEPSNCRWITNLQQQNNKRNSHYLEYNGEKHTIAEWARITGIPTSTIIDRIRRNFTIQKILNTNYKHRK